MKDTIRVERTTVVGRYELVGVNGSLLPASMDHGEAGAGDRHHCSVVAGELRTISSGGTWRFLPSALDRTSGEIRLSSGLGQTSAAVTGVSLVHRMRGPELPPGAQAHWVYIRRSQNG